MVEGRELLAEHAAMRVLRQQQPVPTRERVRDSIDQATGVDTAAALESVYAEYQQRVRELEAG